MGTVKELTYVVAQTTDLAAWRNYGTEVLGFEIGVDSGEKLFYLRSDEHHHRLAIRQGKTDEVASIGFEVADRDSFEALGKRLDSEGVELESGTPDEAADRRVSDFVQFTCPHTGVQVELVIGHEKIFTPHFNSPRGLSGFVSGEMGMGHVVLYTQDVVAAAEFYVRALGFGVTDYAIIPGVGPLAAFLHCNERHHSLALFGIPGVPRKIQHVMFETQAMDDVGLSYDLCLDREITSTALGRHHNDHTFSFYFRNPSGWHFEFGWKPRIINPENWRTERYELRPGNAWGHAGLLEMV